MTYARIARPNQPLRTEADAFEAIDRLRARGFRYRRRERIEVTRAGELVPRERWVIWVTHYAAPYPEHRIAFGTMPDVIEK